MKGHSTEIFLLGFLNFYIAERIFLKAALTSFTKHLLLTLFLAHRGRLMGRIKKKETIIQMKKSSAFTEINLMILFCQIRVFCSIFKFDLVLIKLLVVPWNALMNSSAYKNRMERFFAFKISFIIFRRPKNSIFLTFRELQPLVS